ncbi:MipA/OmpV family protein [Marinomonas rhizomae]|uniref:MipA/OmpV family protein n=1 Tax=Marinomonas rhizomae TaxID=491948 RepID=UPI002104FD88|nr:MipA/OmpV family protein [Marinomonas rhizomae]
MKTLFLILALFTPFIAQAEARLGVMGVISETVYKDTDSKSTALPNIAYEGEHFFLRLPEIGYRFFPQRSLQNFAVGLSYERAKFDPDNSDDINISMLDDRDDSVMMFANYRIGPISTKIAQDISGAHDGYYAQISAGFPVPVGAWKIIPSISYQYMDGKMSNHLFGTTQAESTLTSGAIAAYNTGSVSEVKYGLRGIYPLSRNATFIIGISHSRYDDKILQSPIVEDNTITSLLAGLTYSF